MLRAAAAHAQLAVALAELQGLLDTPRCKRAVSNAAIDAQSSFMWLSDAAEMLGFEVQS